MWSELKTLFWLQWKLTRAMFRSRRPGDRMRIVTLLSRIATVLFTLPVFLLMGLALAIGLATLSPSAAYEVVMLVNVFLFSIWLVMPASHSSQIVERFETSRLFVYPISFRGIVAGSTLISLLTVTGLWTIPILLGEMVGLTWHRPVAFPLIALGSLPTFALLVLSGRIMEDFFDLVAGDRRLRGLALGLLTLPFTVCWVGQYGLQYVTDGYTNVPELIRGPLVADLARLDGASGPSEFLEILRPSRLLAWLPPGWVSAGMGLAVRGEWGRGLLFLLLSTVSVALLLWAHAGIVRRLMAGAALSLGIGRVRTRRWRLRLPSPPALSALFRKDWIYLWRSPMPRRLLFSSLFIVIAVALPLRSMLTGEDRPSGLDAALPLLASALIVIPVSMAINLGLTANYLGTIDREGFGTLALSVADRRLVILSANLAVLLYAGLLYLVLATVVALLANSWELMPLVLYVSLCLQIGSTPAYNLAALMGPFRAQLKFRGGRQRGNVWGILGFLVSAPPVLGLVALPYLFWRPGLILSLPLAGAYGVGLYLLTLKPLARLLQSREYKILEAVTAQE